MPKQLKHRRFSRTQRIRSVTDHALKRLHEPNTWDPEQNGHELSHFAVTNEVGRCLSYLHACSPPVRDWPCD
jgi:hypothetical protein